MKTPSSFIAITSEGGLLPADFLHELPDPKTTIEGVTPVAYHLAEGERLNEQINRSWNRLKGCWENFKKAVAEKTLGDPTTTDTRERWLFPLFQELGFGRLTAAKPIEVDGHSYPVSHGWNQVPIHLVGSHADLDCRTPGAIGAAKASPHSLVQSALNASEAHLWGIVSNGLNLRLLRDNIALTRLAFVEFDLQAMFDGDLYSEFFVLWLVCHQSRFEGGNVEEGSTPTVAHRKVWLERWKKAAEDKTLRALDDLYPGVKKAIAVLGAGLVSNRANVVLLEKLRTGQLTTQEFYKQVLRVIYRMLFLLVAEDRALLHVPDESEAALKARRRYRDFYSLARLRALTLYRAGTPHPDLWQVFQLVTAKLGSDTGCPELALPPLGSFLWTAGQSTPDLLNSLISNRHFLEAVHALTFVQNGNVRRAVDYKNLGSEELGSVYQGLLEMHPRINADAGSFELDIAAGNERKTSGSYYTPDSLVQCLLDSALEPVIAERLAKAKTPKEKETALLSLKVCDKAAGSGHFIIRAGHRIARHLARVRSGEEEPSPTVYRTALRDVIGHCLYGVDINPMAVELCKVTLWLEAIEPGKPLSFLDHHIRCGNSLLGTTPELISAGLPDETFEAIEGDDTAACSSLKKLNRAQREGLRHLFIAEDTAIRERMHQAAAAIDEISDSRPEDIHRKEAAFRNAQQNYDFQKAWDLANLWCAAFVIKKHFAGGAIASGAAAVPASLEASTPDPQPSTIQTGLFGGTEEAPKAKVKKAKAPSRAGSETPIGITTQYLRDFVEGGALPDGLLAESKRLAEQYQFFHWHLAFPEVFTQGGFDVGLGNPPWERIKLSEDEWFATSRPEIADAADASIRRDLIAALATESPSLHAQFVEAVRKAEAEGLFIRSSGRFPLCGKGDINTYSIFAELTRNSISPTGRFGCVLPSGIATDKTTSQFFEDLVARQSLVSLYSFDNHDGIFPAVKRSTRFCLLTLTGPARPFTNAIRFVFYARKLEQILDAARRFELTPADIELLNPNTKTCPVFLSKTDCDLVIALYRRIPVLVNEKRESNEWGIIIRRILDMNKRDVLRLCTVVQPQNPNPEVVPIYEAKLFDQFNHRGATYQDKGIRQLSEAELYDPHFLVRSRYWISRNEVSSRLPEFWAKDWLLVWQDVTDTNTMSRTVSATVFPFYGTDFTLRVGFSTRDEESCAVAFLGSLNSFVFDYIARQKIGGTHLSDYILKQLPFIPPASYANPCLWSDSTQCLKAWLLPRVLELTYTAWDLEAFAQDCGWSGPPFRWDEERRFLLRCELDAAFFHLYLGQETEWRQQPAALTQAFPTPRAAVAYILDTFPIVKRKDEAKFSGDYRTKRVILEIYDALAESMQTGMAYQTRLDPPPADARCCHPPRQVSIPAPTWMDRPLVLPTSRRVVLAPDRYRATVVPHLLYQAGGSISFERFRKAYWLLTEPRTLERYASDAVGEIARGWGRTFRDTLEKDRFIEHLKGAVGRQLHFIHKNGERWLELRDPKVADDEHIVFDARLALLVADLWPVTEPIAPLAPAEEITIQELEAVL